MVRQHPFLILILIGKAARTLVQPGSELMRAYGESEIQNFHFMARGARA